MAVDSSRSSVSSSGAYGPIEAITLSVLYEELIKLHGTMAEDTLINHERRVSICDDFIDELGLCINMSILKYDDDKAIYDRVFDGLQVVINLIHGDQQGLQGADGKPRLMDQQESRLVASERLTGIIQELQTDTMRRGTQLDPVVRPVIVEPRKRLKEGINL